MSSHGVPHEAQHGDDLTGKKVGLLAALLAIGLTLVTIASHRTHTHGIVARSEANDHWSYYQSKKIKYHNLELGIDLITAQGLKGEAPERLLQKYGAERERYDHEAKEIREKAELKEKESEHAEHRALRFDLAEEALSGDRPAGRDRRDRVGNFGAPGLSRPQGGRLRGEPAPCQSISCRCFPV